jgi:hypothetical protein
MAAAAAIVIPIETTLRGIAASPFVSFDEPHAHSTR